MAILPILGNPKSGVNFARASEAQFIGVKRKPLRMRGKAPKDQPFLSYFRYNIYEGPDFHKLKQSFELVKESS